MSTPVVHIRNKEDFQQWVINSTEKIVLLNFWAWWSDACRTMEVTLYSLNHLLKERYIIVCADWDRQKWLADQLQVRGVPTLLIFEHGQVKARRSGVISPDELQTYLNQIN